MWQHERDLEYIKGFRMIDDDFMKMVFDNKAAIKELLKIILENDDFEIVTYKVEYVVPNFKGRGIRIDIYAKNSKGEHFAIEIQRSDKGARYIRARFIGGMLDAELSKPGDNYDDLPPIYVIFITENDVIGRGRSIYHIENTVVETGDIVDDKMHIIYVNGQSREDSEIGLLMHDFFQSDPDKIHNPVLAERVRYLKNTEEGVGSMCRAMEEMRAEVAAEAAAKAAAETAAKAAKEAAEKAAKAAKEAEKKLRAAGVAENVINETVACILNRTA